MKAAASKSDAFDRVDTAKPAAFRGLGAVIAGAVACFIACPATGRADPPLKVWVADAMTRVSRTEAPKPNFSAALNAARGEWESFQVVITGPPNVVKGARLEASSLKGPGTTMIPPATILREHYVRVTQSTPHAPLPAGDYADALVPQEFPWQELTGKIVNQPFWVDVFVPYPTPPGTYSGAITVGDSTVTIPLTVEVFGFDMPVEPRLRTAFTAGWQRIAEVHGLNAQKEPLSPELTGLMDQYYELLARHKLSVDRVYASPAGLRTSKINDAQVEAGLRKHLLHRHVSTLGLPISRHWPFADPLNKDRAAAQRYVAQWMKLLAKIRCESRGYVAIPELAEPNSVDAYAEVRRWGEFLNEIEHREGILMPFLIREQPTPDDGWWGRLDGTVDIWVPDFASVWQDLESPDGSRDIARRLKAGDEVWTRPGRAPVAAKRASADAARAEASPAQLPVWALDYQPMNHRVVGWLLPLHGITGLTCWETLFASPGVDVWTEAGNFKVGSDTVFNGDGSYIYPATLKRHGAHAPVASMRLKWVREMAEDYDYLMLARELGVEKEARKLAETFARGFGDWEPDHEKLAAARLKLGELIAQKSKAIPVIATPPNATPATAAEAKAASSKPSPPISKTAGSAKETPARTPPAKESPAKNPPPKNVPAKGKSAQPMTPKSSQATVSAK